LQTLLDYSDTQTAEAVRCDLRWKVATGMALDDAGFDASTLVYWRRRLAKSERPHRINDAVKRVIELLSLVILIGSILVQLVTGFLNAMTYNLSYFDKNAIPKGMLHLTGDYSNDDLAAFPDRAASDRRFGR
jgi:xanthosine utilization system XapX-like protein